MSKAFSTALAMLSDKQLLQSSSLPEVSFTSELAEVKFPSFRGSLRAGRGN